MLPNRISIIIENIKVFLKKVITNNCRLNTISSCFDAKLKNTEPDYTEQRKYVGNIIISVMTERINVKKALLLFPKGCEDPSIKAAWHALCHFEADEDIKLKDTEYNNSQIELLELIAYTFKDGEPLAQNIIDAYEPYYKGNPISYETGLFGTIKKLFRMLYPD